MGYRCTWIAVHERPLDQILALVSFERTGERLEFSEPGFNAIEMPDWSIFIADGSRHFMEIGEEQAVALSRGGRSLFFTCSDTVMCTQIVEYVDGIESWRVEYEGVNGIGDATISGDPPRIVHDSLLESKSEQEADDEADYIYDTTAKIGMSLTGFRHDSVPAVAGNAEPIEELRRVPK